MNAQNLYEIFSSDPVEFNLKSLKAKLAVALVELIRKNDWNQAAAAKELNTSQPRISNLFRGKLDRFSIDSLLEMMVRTGYKLETDFDPSNERQPLSLTLRRATL